MKKTSCRAWQLWEVPTTAVKNLAPNLAYGQDRLRGEIPFVSLSRVVKNHPTLVWLTPRGLEVYSEAAGHIVM